ncbi:MAG: NAD-dependent epimerase/dehydratase family protein [Clostridia bacterium]|nr:NAD-dependent epimerase/dehydratase family protein [Clostridia bacterium]
MNILVTGKDSYIGDHFKAHMENAGHTVHVVDTLNDMWEKTDFSIYDTVVHVAAIVHDNAKTASPQLFEKVNTLLPVRIATLAKNSGVKQFVFISTMGVYGIDKTLNYENGIIASDTPLSPKSLYGKSKLEAEHQLNTMSDNNFKVAIVRPPNVYGHGCNGNYIRLFEKLSYLMPICPQVYTNIRQSMIYIDNLSELIKLIIEECSAGVFLPQDDYAPNTVELITLIRSLHGKKTIKSNFLGFILKFFSKISIIKKVYGGVKYDMSVSDCFESRYVIIPFEKGIELTYLSTPRNI